MSKPLTETELAVIRKQLLEETTLAVWSPRPSHHYDLTRYGLPRLLDFAEQMLPLRDALLAVLAVKTGSVADMELYEEATLAFWQLARKLVETDGAKP